MSGQPMQLPLGVKLRDEATFDSFFGGPNAGVLDVLQRLSDPLQPPEERCVYIWGAPDSGRSHLLQAACHRMAEAGSLAMNLPLDEVIEDRKSTRLNSSHVKISYAVFCLKKKIIVIV